MSITSRLRHNMTLAKVSCNDVAGAGKRRRDRELADRLSASGFSLESVDFAGTQYAFIIDSRSSARLAALLQELEFSADFRDTCACVTLTRARADLPLPPLTTVMHLLDNEGIDVYHLTADLSAMRIVVDEHAADRVATELLRFYTPRLAHQTA